MTIQHLYPTTRPSLDLNFARTKRLDPRVTFTRGSTATYVGSDGLIKTAASNEARFDHDPATGESLGLLVEEARTNSQTYSNNFATNWTLNQNGTAYVIPNAAQSPSGQYDASKLINNTGAYIQGPLFITGNNIGFGMSARFDLSTKTVTTQGSVASTSITEMGNGWFRCAFMPNTNIKYAQVVFAKAAESSVLTIEHWVDAIRLSTTGGLTGGILIWGAQVEAGTFPTSYIPTPATFTSRASTATYYDANGTIQTAGSNVARSNAYFPDANGVMRPAGLLLEAAATNLLFPSIPNLTSGTWVTAGGGSISTNQSAAPDGTNTASHFISTTLGNTIRRNLTTTLPAGTTVTVSFFAKYISGLTTLLSDVNDTYTFSAQLTSSWKRYSYTAIVGSSFWVDFNYGLGDASTVALWGVQVEASPYPTSYIPTTSSTVTRAADVSSSSTVTRSADVASMTAFPYLYGTFFARYKQQPPTGLYRQIFSVGTASAYGAFVCRTQPNDTVSIVLPGIVDLNTTTNTGTSGFNNAATARVLGNYAVCLNGGTVAKTSSTSDNTNNSVITFMYGTTGATSGGHISRFTYYPTRLTDAQLQALTL